MTRDSSPMTSPWLGRLGNLNVSRSQSRGPAPHKPLMLLTVIYQIEAGEIGPEGWGLLPRRERPLFRAEDDAEGGDQRRSVGDAEQRHVTAL